jgi:DNA-binding beta-propeller fold protein YncE
MQPRCSWTGVVQLRRWAIRLGAAVALLVAGLAATSPARAAMEYQYTLRSTGRFEFYHPYAVTADSVGNAYVVDTQHHRIVKFIAGTRDRIAFGKFGSGHGKLTYPEGLAVEEDMLEPRTLVFVADTGNSRIVVFDGDGKFVHSFGDLGAGAGQLDHPNSIATVPGVPGGGIYVSDARNNRVSVFTQKGHWLKSFDCSGCPGGSFHTPGGIGIREVDGAVEIYVTDVYGGRVNVLDGEGNWLRSFGTEGEAPGQLFVPGEIAVDSDGSAWVVESSNTKRVSKFDPDGVFRFSFSRGSVGFNQPHGVALDPTGSLYVVNSSESVVDVFKEKAPELKVLLSGDRQHWIDTSGAWFNLTYNGVEQTCLATGQATVVVDPTAPSPARFDIVGAPVTINNTVDSLVKMDMSATQVSLVQQAWNDGKRIQLQMAFRAKCQDDLRLRLKDRHYK